MTSGRSIRIPERTFGQVTLHRYLKFELTPTGKGVVIVVQAPGCNPVNLARTYFVGDDRDIEVLRPVSSQVADRILDLLVRHLADAAGRESDGAASITRAFAEAAEALVAQVPSYGVAVERAEKPKTSERVRRAASEAATGNSLAYLDRMWIEKPGIGFQQRLSGSAGQGRRRK